MPSAPREKSIKTIQDEIRSVIRQITATVTFLPLLETTCESFILYSHRPIRATLQAHTLIMVSHVRRSRKRNDHADAST